MNKAFFQKCLLFRNKNFDQGVLFNKQLQGFFILTLFARKLLLFRNKSIIIRILLYINVKFEENFKNFLEFEFI